MKQSGVGAWKTCHPSPAPTCWRHTRDQTLVLLSLLLLFQKPWIIYFVQYHADSSSVLGAVTNNNEGDIYMYKNAVDCWPGLESHHLILTMSSLLQSPKSFCSPLNSGRRVKCHKDGAGGTRHTWIVLDPQTSDAGASRLSAATCLRTEEHALWRQKVLSNLWWLIRGRIKKKKFWLKNPCVHYLKRTAFLH